MTSLLLVLQHEMLLQRKQPLMLLLLVGMALAIGPLGLLGMNRYNEKELAGVCFSPDGTTLFVNIYDPGITLAITGPWPT